MQILIADSNPPDLDRYCRIIPIASPEAKCLVCTDASYLHDFLENFNLNYIFFGSFEQELTLEELILTVRQHSDKVAVVHYASCLSDDQIERLKQVGCHAVIKRVDDIETEVNALKRIFNGEVMVPAK